MGLHAARVCVCVCVCVCVSIQLDLSQTWVAPVTWGSGSRLGPGRRPSGPAGGDSPSRCSSGQRRACSRRCACVIPWARLPRRAPLWDSLLPHKVAGGRHIAAVRVSDRAAHKTSPCPLTAPGPCAWTRPVVLSYPLHRCAVKGREALMRQLCDERRCCASFHRPLGHLFVLSNGVSVLDSFLPVFWLAGLVIE